VRLNKQNKWGGGTQQKPSRASFTAESLLRLHDAMQNWHSQYFVYATPVSGGAFYKHVKQSPALQALIVPATRLAQGRLQLYQLSGALQLRAGITEPVLGPQQNKATRDSSPTVHFPSSATAKITSCSHRSCDPGAAQAQSVHSLGHPCPEG